MPRGRYKMAPTLASVRSAISNGSTIIAEADHRSAPMRRLRDLMAAMTSDLGGPTNVSEAERLLIRRAAVMALQCEMLEQRWAANDHEASATQLDLYTRTSGNLRRVLETLGIGLPRRAIDVTPGAYASVHLPVAAPSLVRDLINRYRHDPPAFREALRSLDPRTRLTVKLHAANILYPGLVKQVANEVGQPITIDDEVDADLYEEVQGGAPFSDPYGLFEADEADNGHPDLCSGPATVHGAEGTTMKPRPPNSPTELDQDRGGQHDPQPKPRIARIRYGDPT